MKTVKYALMVLAATFIGIFSNPEMLAATNTVELNGVSNLGVVETVVPEPEPVVEEAPATVATPAVTTPAAPKAGVATAAPTSAATPVVTGQPFVIPNTIQLTEYQAKDLSYSNTYHYKKLYYGHNSSNLLSGIRNLSVGDIIVADGVSYTVSATANYTYYEGCEYKGQVTSCLDNDPLLMNNIAKKALGHKIAVMTCNGKYVPEWGTEDHRFVVFAD